MKKTISYCLFLILLASKLSGEIKQEKTSQQKSPISSFFSDHSKIWTAPVRWNRSEWITSSVILGATSLAILFDEPIYREIKNFQNKNSWVSSLSPVITELGGGAFNLGVFGAYFIAGKIFNSPKALDTSYILFQSLIHSAIVVQVGKHFFSRQRPSFHEGKDGWYGPSKMFARYKKDWSKYDAFPSGHTITIWTTATVLAEQYKHLPLVPIVSYTLASLAGISRVTEDTHWFSDVILGAALGYGIAKLTASSYHQRHSFQVSPEASEDGIGIKVKVPL